jgi:hypothetical protein
VCKHVTTTTHIPIANFATNDTKLYYGREEEGSEKEKHSKSNDKKEEEKSFLLSRRPDFMNFLFLANLLEKLNLPKKQQNANSLTRRSN